LVASPSPGKHRIGEGNIGCRPQGSGHELAVVDSSRYEPGVEEEVAAVLTNGDPVREVLAAWLRVSSSDPTSPGIAIQGGAMIWRPKHSVARDLETGAACVAARLRDVGRPDFLQAGAPAPSAGSARAHAPAIGCHWLWPVDSMAALSCRGRITRDRRSAFL